MDSSSATFVTVIVGWQTTSSVCVANAPAVNGGVNWGYSNSMSTRSRNAVLHSSGSSGMVTSNAAVHTSPGASVSPSLMTVVPSGSVHSMSMGVPLSGEPTATNGAVSVSNVTVALKNPSFVKVAVHVTVSPIVYGH